MAQHQFCTFSTWLACVWLVNIVWLHKHARPLCGGTSRLFKNICIYHKTYCGL